MSTVWRQSKYCCERPAEHALFERRIVDLERKFECDEVIEVIQSARSRRAIELIKELDGLLGNRAYQSHPTLVRAIEQLKVRIGSEVFGIEHLIKVATEVGTEIVYTPEEDPVDPEVVALDCRIESTQATLRRLEAERERALERPQDVYEPGTYLIVERRGIRRQAVRPPELYHKDEDGRWWSSSQIGSHVSWWVVRRALEDERNTWYNVETMREL